jgi:hypothetical protein
MGRTIPSSPILPLLEHHQAVSHTSPAGTLPDTINLPHRLPPLVGRTNVMLGGTIPQ